MNRNYINYFVDLAMAIAFIIVTATGIFKFPGLIDYFGLRNSIVPLRAISIWHDWSGVVLVFLVFIHLVLHWNWFIAMTSSLIRRVRS